MTLSGWLNWFSGSIVGQLGTLGQKLDAQNAMLQQLQAGQAQIMESLADILAKVQAEKTVEDSLMALTQSLGQQLKDALANQDQATMQQIADALTGNTAAMSAAVTANTPAAPGAASVGTGAAT